MATPVHLLSRGVIFGMLVDRMFNTCLVLAPRGPFEMNTDVTFNPDTMLTNGPHEKGTRVSIKPNWVGTDSVACCAGPHTLPVNQVIGVIPR